MMLSSLDTRLARPRHAHILSLVQACLSNAANSLNGRNYELWWYTI